MYSCISVASKYYMDIMVKKGLLTIIKESFKDVSEEIFEHILWALCNIISECVEYKIHMYELGIYHLVINTFHSFKKALVIRRTFAWFISNSLRTKPYINDDMVI